MELLYYQLDYMRGKDNWHLWSIKWPQHGDPRRGHTFLWDSNSWNKDSWTEL